jgi:hypothetical protein
MKRTLGCGIFIKISTNDGSLSFPASKARRGIQVGERLPLDPRFREDDIERAQD